MGKRVVVVDDEKDLCDLLARALRSRHADLQFFMAHDGESGLQLLRKVRPHLAILDVKMPRMNGYEVLNRMREEETLKRIPVMMLTSLTEGSGKSDEAWARSLEVEAFLTKPSDLDMVVRRVEELLGLPIWPAVPDREEVHGHPEETNG